MATDGAAPGERLVALRLARVLVFERVLFALAEAPGTFLTGCFDGASGPATPGTDRVAGGLAGRGLAGGLLAFDDPEPEPEPEWSWWDGLGGW